MAASNNGRKPGPKADELEILFPERSLETSQGVIAVNPFKFKNFQRVLEIVNRYVSLFGVQPEDDARPIVEKIMQSGEAAVEDMAELILMGVTCDRAVIDEMTWDEVVDLLLLTITVNADFFVQKLSQGSSRLSGVVQNPLPGLRASPDSSELATVG
jgi:hypothetical protein